MSEKIYVLSLTENELNWLESLKKRYNFLKNVDSQIIQIPDKEKQEKMMDSFFEKLDNLRMDKDE